MSENRTITAPAAPTAREVADEIKAGHLEETGQKLAQDFLALPRDGKAFQDLLHQVKVLNEADRKNYAWLPGLEYGADDKGDLRVSVTTPGKVFGNMWRNKDEVFADIKHKKTAEEVFSPAGTGVETVIAEANTTVETMNNTHVIAEGGSRVAAYMHSQVTAQPGSTVDAHDNARVTSRGATINAHDNAHVTATGTGHEGEYMEIRAWDDAHVIAGAGVAVGARGFSQVTAEKGALVIGQEHSQIDAKAGSMVAVDDDAKVTAETSTKIFQAGNSKVIAAAGAKIGSGKLKDAVDFFLAK